MERTFSFTKIRYKKLSTSGAKRDGKSRRPARRHLSVLLPPGRATDIDIMNRYTEEVRWEILLLDPVNDWFLALCKDDPLTADKVEEALDELALCGPQLGRPLADRIHGSKIHNLKVTGALGDAVMA
jgi:hypothetical protein